MLLFWALNSVKEKIFKKTTERWSRCLLPLNSPSHTSSNLSTTNFIPIKSKSLSNQNWISKRKKYKQKTNDNSIISYYYFIILCLTICLSFLQIQFFLVHMKSQMEPIVQNGGTFVEQERQNILEYVLHMEWNICAADRNCQLDISDYCLSFKN